MVDVDFDLVGVVFSCCVFACTLKRCSNPWNGQFDWILGSVSSVVTWTMQNRMIHDAGLRNKSLFRILLSPASFSVHFHFSFFFVGFFSIYFFQYYIQCSPNDLNHKLTAIGIIQSRMLGRRSPVFLLYDGNRTPLDLLCERKTPTTLFPERKSPTSGTLFLSILEYVSKKLKALTKKLTLTMTI